jgi:uncharacterized membrane protein YkvA (DUF1232 family)
MFERLRAMGKTLKSELTVYRLVLMDPRTPRAAKILLGLAVGYLLLPFDLIPDIVPVIGHRDDAVVVPALVAGAVRMTSPEVLADARLKADVGRAQEFRDSERTPL